jgi:hypothetical protein
MILDLGPDFQLVFTAGVLNRFGAHGDNGAHPVGQTGDRQRIPGKLRRKSMSGPSLRRIPGQPSPKTAKHPHRRAWAGGMEFQV